MIEGELGRGAMGAVFRARDPQGRAVALKVMLSQGSSKQRLERFRQEIELTQGLSHPGIVRVLGAGLEGELPCLILELVEGTDLEELFQNPGTDLDDKLRLVEEVARAVDYAHGQGVVHRDLKPANVLVSHEGRARVTDFGLARDLDRKTRLTVTGQGLGTPAYMSPEQVMGEKNTGPAVDVYALGVMLFEALTGELPFDASTPMALYDSILKTKAPRPSSLSPQAARYDRLVESALAKDPARRLTSAGALARELEALRLGLAPQRGGPWPWLALAGLLLGAAGLAWAALPRPEPPQPARPSATPSATSSAPVPPKTTPSRTPEQRAVAEARSLLERGELEEALGLLQRSGHDRAPLALRLSSHVAACARAREALDKLDSYLGRDHAKVPGWLQAAQGALEEAAPDLQRSPRALLLTARLADCRLDIRGALDPIKQLLALPSVERHEEAYEGLLLFAELAGAGNKVAARLELLERAIKLRPSRPEARFRRALYDPRADGSRPLDALARDFPGHPQLLNLQAAQFLEAAKAKPEGSAERANNLKRAEIKIRHAIAKTEAASGMLIGLSRILDAGGRRADADVAQARALKLARERGLVAYWCRVGHLARRRYEAEKDPAVFKLAHAALMRAKGRDSDNPAVRGELAILRWVLGPRTPREEGYRAVRKQLQAAVDQCRVNWETNFYLGHTLRYSAQHQDAAIRAFDQAIALNPKHAWSHLGRGATYLAQGKRYLAAADARRALELKPGWKSAQDLLSQAQR